MSYLLVTVIDRDISVTKHISYKDAFAYMKEEFARVMEMDVEEVDRIIKEQNGEGFDFLIDKDSAWANARCGEMACDWEIYEISQIIEL